MEGGGGMERGRDRGREGSCTSSCSVRALLLTDRRAIHQSSRTPGIAAPHLRDRNIRRLPQLRMSQHHPCCWSYIRASTCPPQLRLVLLIHWFKPLHWVLPPQSSDSYHSSRTSPLWVCLESAWPAPTHPLEDADDGTPTTSSPGGGPASPSVAATAARTTGPRTSGDQRTSASRGC